MISLLAVGRRQESRHSPPPLDIPLRTVPPDCATFFLLVSEQWQQKALLQHIENLNPTTEKSAGKITNQILHNDREYQEVAVGGPNRRPTNPRWRTAAILKKKTVKTLYLCNRLTDLDEI